MSKRSLCTRMLAFLILSLILISMLPATASEVGEKEHQLRVNSEIVEKILSIRLLMQVDGIGSLLRSIQYTMFLLIPALVILFGSLYWSRARALSQVKRRTAQLKKAIAERERLQEQRERFMSVITHELRTPLASIEGYMDYIDTGKLGPIPEKVESCLKIVREQSNRLLSLTNDLLDFRYLESGKFKLDKKPLNYHEVIALCTHEIEPMIKEKEQQFKMNIPDEQLIINGDRNRLCQVLINLFSNATKFTPEGNEIILQVEKDGSNIKTQVTDTGIGIKEEDLERVFEAFTKIEKPTYIKGTGLGLSISKGLVEAHGGKIWIESEGEGKGATFIFTIPEYKGE